MNRPASERAVLSCCLLDPKILRWVELEADDFFDPKNRIVWNAMQSLSGDDVGVDLALLEDTLTKAGHLDAIGGLAYLGDLATVAATSSNVEHYAAELRTATLSRRALLAAADVERLVTRGVEGDELLDRVASTLSGLERAQAGEAKTLPEMVRDEAKAITAYFTALSEGVTVHPGVPTGIGKLDELIGGIPLGIPSIVGARPEVGKSSFALNVTRHATNSGYGVHWFATEDGPNTFSQRWIAHESGLDSSDLRSRRIGTKGQLAALAAAERALRNHTGLLWERASGRGASWVVRRIQAEAGRNKTKLVVVDLLASLNPPERGMGLRDAIGANMRILSACAADLDIGLLFVAHTKRQLGDEPSINDLAESDFLGRDGKLILILRAAGEGHLDCWVVKNHQGEKGLITCTFDKARCRIR